jgi:hypothetical protein
MKALPVIKRNMELRRWGINTDEANPQIQFVWICGIIGIMFNN